MKISRQLQYIFVFGGVCLCIVVGLTASQLTGLSTIFKAYEQGQTAVYKLNEIKVAVLVASRADLMMPTTEKLLADTDALVHHDWAEVASSLNLEERKMAEKVVLGNWDNYLKNYRSALKISSSNPEDALSIPDRIYTLYLQPMAAELDLLVGIRQTFAASSKVEIRRYLDRLIWVVLTPLLTASAVVVMLLTRFGHALKIRLQGIILVTEYLSKGDLTIRVEAGSKDEIGMLLTAMQKMVGNLKEIIGEVQATADQVFNTATQVSASSSHVADSSLQQSEAASLMAAAVEEMTVSIDQVSVNATLAKNASSHSGELSEQGAVVIQNAVLEMTKIETAVKVASQIIEDLEQHSGDISTIVSVIREIADQTNLLALNAAIEAARAGEEGRGFAVVADEVRKLSERTSNSIQEIAGMIDKIQSGTRQAVKSMESGVAQVSNGLVFANQAGNSITQIRTEAARVAQEVGAISDSLKEQSMASIDITKNVEKIARMTEENSASVKETANDAQHLKQLASSLHGSIGRFKV